MTWKVCIGVTHVQMTSSATGISATLSTALLELTVLVRVVSVGASGVSSVGAGKCTRKLVLKLSKVSTSIVERSRSGGTLADKLTDNGSMFSGHGY